MGKSTKHLMHRNGGRITEVSAIAHSTHKGVAYWFFIGNVDWRDGSKSIDAEISPSCLVRDEDDDIGRREVDDLLRQMNAYLATVGEWHDQKIKKGLAYSWTPHKPSGRVDVTDNVAEAA